MLLCFLDESGDHVLKKVDPQYPVFVLAGVLVEPSHYREVIVPEMHELKLRFFGSETIVLHTADMTRNRKGFEGLKDPATRQRWYQALNAAMARWKYTVVAVVIDKLRHREAYGDAALDPYELSLALVAERLVLEAEKLKARVELVAESRGHHLDTRLNRVWEVQTVEQ